MYDILAIIGGLVVGGFAVWLKMRRKMGIVIDMLQRVIVLGDKFYETLEDVQKSFEDGKLDEKEMEIIFKDVKFLAMELETIKKDVEKLLKKE